VSKDEREVGAVEPVPEQMALRSVELDALEPI
jgi:hypothetical protein